jgi:hypothetical protein
MSHAADRPRAADSPVRVNPALLIPRAADSLPPSLSALRGRRSGPRTRPASLPPLARLAPSPCPLRSLARPAPLPRPARLAPSPGPPGSLPRAASPPPPARLAPSPASLPPPGPPRSLPTAEGKAPSGGGPADDSGRRWPRLASLM